MSKTRVFLNGKLLPLSEARLSVLDRGLLYGDGVFESLRTYGGNPWQLNEHLKRLLSSARLLKIARLPSARKIKLAVMKTIAINRFRETYVKIIMTRGLSSGHGLDLARVSGPPTLIVLAEEQKEYPKNTFTAGWKAIVSAIKRPDVPSSRIKSLNYLNAVLAKQEANKVGAQEAFLLDERGNLAEGTISNLFIVKFNTIYTPPIEEPILAGLTRQLVIKLARQSAFKVVERTLTPKELYTADECFITFSGAGVVPITRIWKKKIGSGKCGYITDALVRLYEAETRKS